MHTSIYQNSYIIALITFIILAAIFYIFQIGTTIIVNNGKIEKKFNWKYPMAISLIVWLFWHFSLYPQERQEKNISKKITNTKKISDTTEIKNIGKYNKIMNQKIIMQNWN